MEVNVLLFLICSKKPQSQGHLFSFWSLAGGISPFPYSHCFFTHEEMVFSHTCPHIDNIQNLFLKSQNKFKAKKKSQQCYLLAPCQSQTNKSFNAMSLLTMPSDSHRPMNNEKNTYTKNSISERWGSRQKLSGLQGQILPKKTCLIFLQLPLDKWSCFWASGRTANSASAPNI